ncbi:3' exoribonuclease family, domain 1 [Ancylostoma duodenale]|uniref:Putative exosome complex component RRP41 n=1 Tax=Ancylostoma duodenale TaxID=51022 RepID=A0A0C2CXD1_9BILA|nr:3' exoribonuclease family, domain 1 [Ancylostoma duodenale]
MSIVSEHGFRLDGRRPHQIRNISASLGTIRDAEGSAYFEQGGTKILCAVYGPYEGKRSKQLEDRCVINYFELLCATPSMALGKYCFISSMTRFAGVERRQRVKADRKSMEIERLIEKTFEGAVLTHLFPTSQIDIYCQIIQSDGSHLAACVNAASLAMSDAGIPMKGLVAAATCSIVDGQPVVDVNQREETDILPRLTLATLRGEDEVVLVELQNRVHMDHLPALMAAAKDTCKGVHECICAAIVDQLENGAFFLR